MPAAATVAEAGDRCRHGEHEPPRRRDGERGPQAARDVEAEAGVGADDGRGDHKRDRPACIAGGEAEGGEAIGFPIPGDLSEQAAGEHLRDVEADAGRDDRDHDGDPGLGVHGGQHDQAPGADAGGDDDRPLVDVATIRPGRDPRHQHGRGEHRRRERPGPDDPGLDTPAARREYQFLDVGHDERDQHGRERAGGPIEQNPGAAGEAIVVDRWRRLAGHDESSRWRHPATPLVAPPSVGLSSCRERAGSAAGTTDSGCPPRVFHHVASVRRSVVSCHRGLVGDRSRVRPAARRPRHALRAGRPS